jgi:hypothetical protein
LSCGQDHEARRNALIAEHGKSERFPDTAAALWLLGRRGEVHPRDAMAWVYRDQAAADAWHASTAEHYGVPCLGTAPCDGGVLGVYDLRPMFDGHGVALADPALPDDWEPPCKLCDPPRTHA